MDAFNVQIVSPRISWGDVTLTKAEQDARTHYYVTLVRTCIELCLPGSNVTHRVLKSSAGIKTEIRIEPIEVKLQSLTAQLDNADIAERHIRQILRHAWENACALPYFGNE